MKKKLISFFILLNLLLLNSANASENNSWTSWLRPITMTGAVAAIGYHCLFPAQKKEFDTPKLRALSYEKWAFTRLYNDIYCDPNMSNVSGKLTEHDLKLAPQAAAFIKRWNLIKEDMGSNWQRQATFSFRSPSVPDDEIKKDLGKQRDQIDQSHKLETASLKKAAQQNHFVKCVGIGAAAGLGTLGALSWFANNNK